MAAQGKINILQLVVQHVKEEWVMWPLVFLSVLTITIVLERVLVIMIDRLKLSPSRLADRFLAAMEKNGGNKEQTIEEMVKYIGKKETICTGLLKNVFKKYKEGIDKKLPPVELKRWIRDAMEEQAVVELPALESHLGWLAIISNVATLMGLFGTVYGMIEAFYSMAQSVGGVKADEMAGGIAVALIATLFGLFVAIPSLVLYNFIKNYTEAHVLRIDDAMRVVIDKLVE